MADPSISSANACLQYMQYLEYSKELIRCLRANAGKGLLSQTALEWVSLVTNECKRLEKDLNAVHREASRIRKLVRLPPSFMLSIIH